MVAVTADKMPIANTMLAMALVNIINDTGIKRHIRNVIVYLGRCLTGINLETTLQLQRSMYI
jgi:hypothetical protein